MEASSYDQAPFIPEFYDYVVPYAARPDVRFYAASVCTAETCGTLTSTHVSSGDDSVPPFPESPHGGRPARLLGRDTSPSRGRWAPRIRCLQPLDPQSGQAGDGTETDEEPPFTLPDGRTIVRRHRMVDRDLINQVNTGELIFVARRQLASGNALNG